MLGSRARSCGGAGLGIWKFWILGSKIVVEGFGSLSLTVEGLLGQESWVASEVAAGLLRLQGGS